MKQEHFEKRFNLHRKRVKANADILIKVFGIRGLEAQVLAHDLDKIGPKNLNYQIELSWHYKCLREGKDYVMENGYTPTDKIRYEHYKTQKHHPEYWENVQDMDLVSLSEMCCDWMAMAQELDTDVMEWAYRAFDKYNFSIFQENYIKSSLAILKYHTHTEE